MSFKGQPKESFFAHLLDMPRAFLRSIFRHNYPNNDVDRFYVLHVAVLPLATTLLIGVHFWRVRKDGGLSRPPDKFKPEPYRVVQRSDTRESFAPGVKRTYGLMELVKGTCP